MTSVRAAEIEGAKSVRPRRLHLSKPAVRVLGIAESFVKHESERSVLAGVVMRGDGIIDGFSFATITVGGMDATEGVLNVYRRLQRDDINFIMLNGCIIAWFNVIDLNRVYRTVEAPLLCVTYEESPGLEEYFKRYFPDDWEERVDTYRRNGGREEVALKTGHKVFIRFLGMGRDEAERLLNKFTLQGSVPEPLRVARLLARGIIRTGLLAS